MWCWGWTYYSYTYCFFRLNPENFTVNWIKGMALFCPHWPYYNHFHFQWLVRLVSQSKGFPSLPLLQHPTREGFISQMQLGSFPLLCGYVSIHLIEAQQAYYTELDSKRTSHRLGVNLMNHLWNIVYQIWWDRNKILHQHDIAIPLIPSLMLSLIPCMNT